MKITFNNGSVLKGLKSSTATRGMRSQFIEWSKSLNKAKNNNSR